MSDPTLERIETADGQTLVLHVLGDGAPVVCMPGGPGRASAYLEDLAGLSATHTLLRLDPRGTGLSPLPDDRASLAFPNLAEDLEAVRAIRGLETIDLLGHSAGCSVSLMYAARHPERLTRLVLVTPSAFGFADTSEDVKQIRTGRSDEPWYAELHEIEEMLKDAPSHRRARFDPELRPFGYGRWDERCQEHAASTDTQMSMRAGAAFFPTDLEFDMDWWKGALAEMPAPTLVVVGERDGMTGVEAGHVVAGLLPNASVVEIPGAGHYPWVDAPDAFRDAVVSFLT